MCDGACKNGSLSGFSRLRLEARELAILEIKARIELLLKMYSNPDLAHSKKELELMSSLMLTTDEYCLLFPEAFVDTCGDEEDEC